MGKWEDIITEGLPDVAPIDDLRIQLYWNPTGWGSVLAYARPIFYRQDAYGGLPYFSTVTLTGNLIDGDYSSEAWETIMTHEVGHALGFVSSVIDEHVGTETIMGLGILMARSPLLPTEIYFTNWARNLYTLFPIFVCRCNLSRVTRTGNTPRYNGT